MIDKKSTTILTVLLMLVSLTFVYAGSQYKESALSWQKQAKDTRATVASVYGELEKIGDKGNTDAKDLISDAVKWLGEGDKSLSKADGEMETEQFKEASYDYNMAWQYYVKAATAGLNAKRILTGQ